MKKPVCILLTTFLLALCIGPGAQADTICDDPDMVFAPYESPLNLSALDSIMALFTEIPMNMSVEMGVPEIKAIMKEMIALQ